MRDMVAVISQLTQPESTDCSKFDQVIDHHFEKFRYFYNLLQCDGFDTVKSMDCSCADDHQSLQVELLFDKKNQRDVFNTSFMERINTSKTFQAKYFIVVLTPTKNSLNISIENKLISREDDIYGAGFNSN